MGRGYLLSVKEEPVKEGDVCGADGYAHASCIGPRRSVCRRRNGPRPVRLTAYGVARIRGLNWLRIEDNFTCSSLINYYKVKTLKAQVVLLFT